MRAQIKNLTQSSLSADTERTEKKEISPRRARRALRSREKLGGHSLKGVLLG